MIYQKKNSKGIMSLLKQIVSNICRNILDGRLVKIMQSIRRKNGNAINLLVGEITLQHDRSYGFSRIILQILVIKFIHYTGNNLQIMVNKRNAGLDLVL